MSPGKDDKPDLVDNADADLVEYKFAHDRDNLYTYFRSRGVIGRRSSPCGPVYSAPR